VQLSSVVLRSANVTTDFDPESVPEPLTVDLKYRANLDSMPQVGEGETKRLGVLVDFQFGLHCGEDDGIVDVLSLTASYLLIYILFKDEDVELDKRCFRHFAEVNGPYNAWPYLRELVQSVTGRVGLGGLTMPVFHPKAVDVTEDEEKGCAQNTLDGPSLGSAMAPQKVSDN